MTAVSAEPLNKISKVPGKILDEVSLIYSFILKRIFKRKKERKKVCSA